MFFFLLKSIFVFSLVSLTYVDCASQSITNAYGCQYCNLTWTTGKGVDCQGFQACRNSIISVTGNRITCQGSYACYNSPKIEISQESGGDISCHGLYSCANAKLLAINIDDEFISCSGEKSCYNSEITQSGNNSYLNCYGTQSCMNSIINETGYAIYFWGYLSGVNSIITLNNSNGNNQTFVHFYGANSGKNTTVLCENDATCNVKCYGDACNEINSIECVSGDDNDCDITLDCEHAQLSDVCSNGYDNDEIYDHLDITIPDFLYDDTDILSTIDNSLHFCVTARNDSTLIKCDDYQDSTCYQKTWYFSSNPLVTNQNYESGNYVICNTGARGGFWNNKKIDINNKNLTISTIRCDGMNSGVANEIQLRYDLTDLTMTTNNDDNTQYLDFYSTGYFSATETKFYSIAVDSASGIQNVNQTLIIMNLYCTGISSCNLVNVNNGSIIIIDNLYCFGMRSCDEIDIGIVNNNIYAYGYAAMGYKGYSTVNNVKNNVYCNGYYSCSLAQIYNVENSVYITASYGIVNGFVNNSANVYCVGDNSCTNGTFTDVSNLYVFGDSALDNSNIYCSNGNTCNIICVSDTDCDDISLDNCQGTCNVKYVDSDNAFVASPILFYSFRSLILLIVFLFFVLF